MAADRPAFHLYTVAAAGLFLAAPAISQTEDHAPVSLPSARVMAQDKPGTESWTYVQPRQRFAKYRTVMIPAAIVYQGPDAQFDGIDQADRAKFADMITQAGFVEVTNKDSMLLCQFCLQFSGIPSNYLT